MSNKDSHVVYVANCEDVKNFTKIGKTSNFTNRRNKLQTSYPLNLFIPSILILCKDENESTNIEELLHSEYYEYNTIHNTEYKGTAKEWFDLTGKVNDNDIIKLLRSENFTNKILTGDELNKYMSELNRKLYDSQTKEKQKYIAKMKSLKLERYNKNKKEINIKPNDIQANVLKNIKTFYEDNNIGKFIAACGVGKTLTSLFISKIIKSKSIIIGVPYKNLLDQWKDEVKYIYPDIEILIVGGNGTNDYEIIKNFIKTKESKIIITTYASCHKIKELTDEENITFDFKIGDEAHHLVSKEHINSKAWIEFHHIKSIKTLNITATEKYIDNKTNTIVYSMDDETIFGKYIYEPISIKWAIDHKKITDYKVVLLKNTEEQVNNIIKNIGLSINNKELFISAYLSLKSIQKYIDLTHILIYCNKTDNATLIIKYITIIIEKGLIQFEPNTLYYKDYHSNLIDKSESEYLNKFKQSKFGILSCVYQLGEGTNIPELNGVVFAENMESTIRIVQCSLRPNRLNKKYPNKIAYYIIPWIDIDNWDEDGTSFEKVKKVISKLGNEDETISQKIVLSEIKNQKNKKNATGEDYNYDDLELEDNENELNKLKLRLRYKGTLKSRCSPEEDELNYIRSLNKELNIQDKHQYKDLRINHPHYIDNPDSYFKKNALWKGWYDFLGIDTTKFIQKKDEWIKFCKEKNIESIDMYNKLCEDYSQLPKEPSELYLGFTNICNELELFNKRR